MEGDSEQRLPRLRSPPVAPMLAVLCAVLLIGAAAALTFGDRWWVGLVAAALGVPVVAAGGRWVQQRPLSGASSTATSQRVVSFRGSVATAAICVIAALVFRSWHAATFAALGGAAGVSPQSVLDRDAGRGHDVARALQRHIVRAHARTRDA